jgi:hypothetical protein
MESVTRRQVHTCTDDVVWEYDLPEPVEADVTVYVAPLGDMKRPIKTAPLYRLQTGDLVLLVTVGEPRIRLRVKATADSDTLQATFESCLEAYLADRD